jgi:hypothetical protein
MKRVISLFLPVALFACVAPQAGGAVIFSESMGSVSGTTAIATHEANNGFDNDGFTYSGTGDVRATTTSSGYTGASGAANIFITNVTDRVFQVSGISTVGYNVGSIDLDFGAFKSTLASDMSTLVLEFSTDGSGWTPISFPAQPTGSGTAVWRLISLTDISIPISSTLELRWRNADTSTQFRIDDITLSGTPVPEAATVLLSALGLIPLLRRRR